MSVKLPPSSSGDFYGLSLDGDSYLSAEWPRLAAAVKGLRPYFESRHIAHNTQDWDATLQGVSLGDDAGRHQWRIFADNSQFYVQVNTGTDASPIWTTRFGVDHDSGVDFLHLINFNHNDFYLSGAKLNPPEPVLNIRGYVRQDGTHPMDVGATLKLADAGVVFQTDQDTGITRQTNDVMNLRAGGSNIVQIETDKVEVLKPILITDGGDESAPDFSWSIDTDTGVYLAGANKIGFTSGGVSKVQIGSSSDADPYTLKSAGPIAATAFYITENTWSTTGAIEVIPKIMDGSGVVYKSFELTFSSHDFYLSEDSRKDPVVNLLPAFDGYINGYQMARGGTELVTIGRGVATATNDGSKFIQQGSSQIDLNVSGEGGLGVAQAINTWYHVFVIKKANGTQSQYADTSVTAANIPAGYIWYRRIGSFKTNSTGSGEVIDFVQRGKEIWWVDPPMSINNATPGTSANTGTLDVPTGVQVQAITHADHQSGGTNVAVYLSDFGVLDEAPSQSAAPLATSGQTSSGASTIQVQARVWTNTSAQIRYRALGNSQVFVVTLGWLDPRGEDGL